MGGSDKSPEIPHSRNLRKSSIDAQKLPSFMDSASPSPEATSETHYDSHPDQPMRDYVNAYSVLSHGDEDTYHSEGNALDDLENDAHGSDADFRATEGSSEQIAEDDSDSQCEHSDEDEQDNEAAATGAAAYGMLGGANAGHTLLREFVLRSGAGQVEQNVLEAMERFIGGSDAFFFGGGNQLLEFSALVKRLADHDDPYILMETINTISESIIMMDAITAERSISPGRLAHALTDILKDPALADDLELHLVACRCIYNLVEVNLDFISNAINHGAIEILVSKVLNIIYIDLTEQCVQALEFMSRERATHSIIIASDGLKACLQNIDFLSTHSQRKCLQIVANACSNVATANFDFVLNALPTLLDVVKLHSDAPVRESAWVAISRIFESFKGQAEQLEQLVRDENILSQMLLVIQLSCNPTSTDGGVKESSMILLLKSLISLVSTSVPISQSLLNLNLGYHIKIALCKYGKSEDSKSGKTLDSVPIEALINAPKEILSLFLILINYTLPIAYPLAESPFLPSGFKENSGKEKLNLLRSSTYRNNCPESFLNFANQIWPVLIGSFHASMDSDIRKRSMLGFLRILHFCSDTELMHITKFTDLVGLLASVINTGHKALLNKEMLATVQAGGDRAASNRIELLVSSCMSVRCILRKSNFNFAKALEQEGAFSDMKWTLKVLSEAGFTPNSCDIAEDDNIVEETPQSAFLERLRNTPRFSLSDKEISDGHHQPLQLHKIFQQLFDILSENLKLFQESYILGALVKSESGGLARVISILSSDALGNDENKWSALWAEFLTIIKSKSISSFELISLGLITKLVEIFENNGPSFGKYATRTFVNVFFKESANFELLVFILQESLTRTETFDVLVSGVKAQLGFDGYTSSLAKQIKIRLIEGLSSNNSEPSESLAGQTVVSVHALATFKAIESFLLQKRVLSDRTDEKSDQDPVGVSSIGSPNASHKLSFWIDGKLQANDCTIFGAIVKSLQRSAKSEKIDTNEVWSHPHEVRFIPAELGAPDADTSKNEMLQLDASSHLIMQLLKCLKSINDTVIKNLHYSAIGHEAFMNWKLTAKLKRQLEEPLIVASGVLPSWSIVLTKKFPFLFPLETRMLFLQSTSFGISRLIHKWQMAANLSRSGSVTEDQFFANLGSLPLGTISRRKVRISRNTILRSAFKVLQKYGALPAVLEIEYFDEVGSGLGPTLEFYSLVCKEFCRTELKMWLNESHDNLYVQNKRGLFPSPIPRQALAKREIFLFNMLGVFIARALLDSRIIDFNFNILFVCLVQDPSWVAKRLDQDNSLQNKLNLLSLVDLELAQSLSHLSRYLQPGEQQQECELSDLAITFVLPGFPEIELVPDGSNISVNENNLEFYLNSVVDYFIAGGVTRQIEGFREGFSSVFPVETLTMFSAEELHVVFGSGKEDWSREAISESIKANHGYSQDSKAISMLTNVMEAFSLSERRDFLQFLTGSPRLPIGGFKAMNPEFTVVRKLPEGGMSSNDYLPSVMTCANYLKLPEYSLEQLMRARLLHSIKEGAGSFHLS